MDYIGNKCQVCDEYFHIGDDVVVCPECGTPHHRECYNNLGHCVNEEKHSHGFDYLEELNSTKENNKSSENDDETGLITCKKCGAKNPSGAFFCSKCGETFIEKSDFQQFQENSTSKNNEEQNSPFFTTSSGTNIFLLDPLAGVKPETDFGENVTAADTAKFVKQNTPYFITIFKGIKDYSKSRFNFSAALFGGGYLLYRKMYKIGTIITIIQALLFLAASYLSYFISTDPVFTQIFNLYQQGDANALISKLSTLSTLESTVMMIYPIFSFGSLIINIVLGFITNRMYFKHCKKQIVKIKNNVEKPEDFNSVVKLKGGVNLGLGISLWVSYIILSYLSNYFY